VTDVLLIINRLQTIRIQLAAELGQWYETSRD
jgi:hypothetical protein